MGNCNYPGIDWSSNSARMSPVQSISLRLLVTCFLVQHVLVPTGGDAVLDFILSKDPDLASNVKTLHPLGNSDNNMLLFTVHLKCDVSTSEEEIRE